jgi:hypothetical protein
LELLLLRKKIWKEVRSLGDDGIAVPDELKRPLSKGRVTLSSGLIALRSAAELLMIQRILTQ